MSSGVSRASYVELDDQAIRNFVDETNAALDKIQYGNASPRRSIGERRIDPTPVTPLHLSDMVRTAQTPTSEGNNFPDLPRKRRRDRLVSRLRKLTRVDSTRGSRTQRN